MINQSPFDNTISVKYNGTQQSIYALLKRSRLGKAGFRFEGSDRVHNLTEDRLRHASGPVHHHPIRYMHSLEMLQQLGDNVWQLKTLLS